MAVFYPGDQNSSALVCCDDILTQVGHFLKGHFKVSKMGQREYLFTTTALRASVIKPYDQMIKDYLTFPFYV